jgi:TolA-binding protein
MRKRVLILTTTAAILACGSAASAQAPGAQGPSTQQSSTTQPTSDPVLQQQNQTDHALERLQDRAEEEEDVFNILD